MCAGILYADSHALPVEGGSTATNIATTHWHPASYARAQSFLFCAIRACCFVMLDRRRSRPRGHRLATGHRRARSCPTLRAAASAALCYTAVDLLAGRRAPHRFTRRQTHCHQAG